MAGDHITREHVPPKQFYPQSLRDGLNLWVVPTHRSCNNAYAADEDYFYHALYPLVARLNSQSAEIILNDLRRRAKKPQTPALMRRILQAACVTTESGIVLPRGIVRMDANQYRLEQVAIKIGRCLFYRDHSRVMPYENCRDIRLCEREEDVPELYTLSWGMSKVTMDDFGPSETRAFAVVDANAGQAETACRQVFDYRPAYLEEERLHLYSLRFWQAFMFCMAFDDPDDSPMK